MWQPGATTTGTSTPVVGLCQEEKQEMASSDHPALLLSSVEPVESWL